MKKKKTLVEMSHKERLKHYRDKARLEKEKRIEIERKYDRARLKLSAEMKYRETIMGEIQTMGSFVVNNRDKIDNLIMILEKLHPNILESTHSSLPYTS